MRIIFFEDFFHPDAGYNTNILSKYLSLDGHEVIIYTSEIDKSPTGLKIFFDISNIDEKDKQFSSNYGIRINRIKTYFYYSGRAIVSNELFKRIKKDYPDLLFINGNDTYIGILATLMYRKLAIPLLFKSSMVEMASENRFSRVFRFTYKFLITPILIKNKIVTVRAQDDPYVTKFLGIPSKLAPFISYGSDLNVFKPVTSKELLRKKYGVPLNAFVLIYAGKLDTSKGIELLIAGFAKTINTNKNITLLIVGDVHKEHQESFQNFLTSSPNHILTYPTQKYETLSEFYALSDLAIFPRQISLSFFNAQACGLPVVGEFNNVNEERLSHGNGLLFEYGNFSDMINKIEQIANLDSEEYSLVSQRTLDYIKNNFDYRKITDQYLQLFRKEIKKQRQLLKK